MTRRIKDLTTLTFTGPRFDDHGLDLDVLPEILAYQKLLIETAKELWRAENPDRQRLPKGFEENLRLKFYQIEQGSVAIPIKRVFDDEDSLMLFEIPDELDEAARLIDESIAAVHDDRPFPERLPKNVVPLFAELGSRLFEGEAIGTRAAGSPATTNYTPVTREHFLTIAESPYEDLVTIIGEVRAADVDRQTFSIRNEAGQKIAASFTPEQETLITEALREHATVQIRVVGTAEFSPGDGSVRRVIRVDSVERQDAIERPEDPSLMPIWEQVAALGAAIPVDEWEKVPADLAANLDAYLYGRRDEE